MRSDAVANQLKIVNAATRLIGGRMVALRNKMRAIDPRGRLEILCERGKSEGVLRTDIESTVIAALILGSLSPWSALSLRSRGDGRVVAQEVLRPFLAHTTKIIPVWA
tara:strand:- start:24 stop:347 length:324 start_codon:yes stop_codon:yes gene_type:complete